MMRHGVSEKGRVRWGNCPVPLLPLWRKMEKDHAELYEAGAFLLAGSEVLALTGVSGSD